MFNLDAVQSALRDFQLDGWLLYDFRGNNPLARRILDLDQRFPGSRRFFYMIPSRGAPMKLVHKIEPRALDHLPGEKQVYVKAAELQAGIAQMVKGLGRVAMEYSPRNAVPTV